MNTDTFSGIRVLLLSGEDFQRSERVSEIIDGVVDKATRDFNLDVIHSEDFKNKSDEFITKFAELIITFPMIAQRRVVVIRNFDTLDSDARKKASKVLLNTPETTFVIIEGEEAKLSPKPKEYFIAESFKTIYENQLPKWIKNRFMKRGKKVTDSAVALMINNTGTGLRELDGEIEKTIIIARDRETVTEDDVKLVVGEFRRDTVYALCNAVGLGDFKEAVKILTVLMETEKNRETYYLAQLYSHIMKISEYQSRVKKGIPHSEAVKVITTYPYFWKLNKMPEQVKNFNTDHIRRSLTVLGRTESTLKRSGIDKSLLMELLIPFIMPKVKKV